MIALAWVELLARHAWQLALLVLLLLGSAFFSGSETALFSLTRGQLFRLRQGGAMGRLVVEMTRRPRWLLNTLLFGNMLVNVAYAGLSAMLVWEFEQLRPGPVATVVVALVPLVGLILIGEVTPKMLAVLLAERWSLIVAGPVAFLGRVFSPPLAALDKVFVGPLTRILAPKRTARADITAEELAAVLDLSAKRGVLDHDTNALLQEIVELTDIRVSEIMVPRVDIIAYDVEAPPAGLIRLFRATRLRKVPVYEGSLDRIIGVVHARWLLLRPTAAPLRELMQPVSFVPEAANIERLLLHFRQTRKQLAIVVDEYGGTAGLVTLEDVLEEIVGDIPDPDEADRGPAVQRISEGEYLLDGDLAVHDWADAFGEQLARKRISTIGGFVTGLLGRIPQVGDEVRHRNLRFVVESMRRRRIGKLRLKLLEAEA